MPTSPAPASDRDGTSSWWRPACPLVPGAGPVVARPHARAVAAGRSSAATATATTASAPDTASGEAVGGSSVWVCPDPAPATGVSGEDGAGGRADGRWPPGVVERLVRELSAPGDPVAIITATPTTTTARPGRATAPAGDAGMVPESPTTHGIVARSGRRPYAPPVPPSGRAGPRGVGEAPGVGRGAGGPALVLAAVPATAAGWVDAHQLPMPREGGVLAVLTGTDQASGRLVDPSWAIVCAARRGGARYVAHLVVLRAEPTHPLTRTDPGAARWGGGPRWAHHDVLLFHRPHQAPRPDPGPEPSRPPRTPSAPGPPRPRTSETQPPVPPDVPAAVSAVVAAPSPPSPADPPRCPGGTTPARASAGGSVWVVAQRSAPAQRAGRYVHAAGQHPAAMLPRLAGQVISGYSEPGDWVLDPLCGIGTTLIEALARGRHGLGIDIDPRWTSIARRGVARLRRAGLEGAAAVSDGDARRADALLPAELAGRVGLLLTAPPQGPLAPHDPTTTAGAAPGATPGPAPGSGGGRGGRAGVLDRGRYRRDLTDVLTVCGGWMRPGGHVVLVTRPWRTACGQLLDLPADTLAAGQRAGLVPVERVAALTGRLHPTPVDPDDDRGPDPGVGVVRARVSARHHRFLGRLRAAGIPAHAIAHLDVLIFTVPPRWP